MFESKIRAQRQRHFVDNLNPLTLFKQVFGRVRLSSGTLMDELSSVDG
jgi:hypothetical protein